MVESVEARIVANQLVKARETAGLTQDDVSQSLNISKTQVDSWERGQSIPSVEEFWALADLYGRSTDYFLLELPSMPKSLIFRMKAVDILDQLPKPARKTLIRFEELCRAEYELEKALGTTRSINFRRSSASDAEALALSERSRLRLGDYSIKDLRHLLILQGVRIFVLPIPELSPMELSGVSWWHETYGPCILVNGKNIPGRRTFTLAHEYAHLIHSDPPAVCAYMFDRHDEKFADLFAKGFLMPSSGVRRVFQHRDYVPGSLTDRELGSIAGTFSVSLEAMSIRLEEVGLVTPGFTKLNIERWEKERRYFRRSRGPKWKRQLGEEFVQLASDAYRKGLVSSNKLSNYFGVDIRETLNAVR